MFNVRNNIGGTTAPSYQIGKYGPTLYQGSALPDNSVGNAGDVYIFQSTSPTIYLRNAVEWIPASDPSTAFVRQVVTTGTAIINGTTTHTSVVANGTTLSLPTGIVGHVLTIKDEAGTAASLPITLTPNGSDLIDGQTTASISVNYGFMVLVYVANGSWVITSRSPSPLQRSDVVSVTDPTINSYSFTVNSVAMTLNPSFSMVYINRMLLRPSEFNISNNIVTFNVALGEFDELEVVTQN